MYDRFLKKAIQGRTLNRHDIRKMLSFEDQNDLRGLFSAAREVRQSFFGNSIFLYGFLYFSTYCRNNCRFCHYRCENKRLRRYRKSLEECTEAAQEMAQAGVHLIDLTMGEDPVFHENGFQPLFDLIRKVRSETGLPVMVSPGVIPGEVINHLVDAGAQWLACYQETHNRRLYEDLRPHQEYDLRMTVKKKGVAQGMLVEEGLLTGVGESIDDLADSIITMQEKGYDQVRVMTFVPQAETPMGKNPIHSSMMEKKVIATMRLAMPDRLIPASLDVDGLDGLKERLDAGANVVTSIVPPAADLAGVANTTLDIKDSRRSVNQVSRILAACGLRIASHSQYERWLMQRQYGNKAALSAEHSKRNDNHKKLNIPLFKPVEFPAYAIH